MACFRCLMVVMALSLASSLTIREGVSTQSRANPIRKVVTLLQDMIAKVKAEGDRDAKIHDEFMCYCSKGSGDLDTSIANAGTKIGQLESSIQQSEAYHKQLQMDLVQHKADRADANAAVRTANAIRAKDAAIFGKDSSDHKQNIAALGKAITALESGATGFLQTSAASVVRQLSVEMDLTSADRDVVSAFLTQSQGYAPQSGEITGILKQMSDTMKSNLADMTSDENSAKQAFAGLVSAKEKTIALDTNAIEKKTVRAGQVAVSLVNMKEDLDDTTKAKLEDETFLAALNTDCKTKGAEYDVVVSTRNDELVALSQTIKILNDDQALELFKKVLPSGASLLQVTVASKQVRNLALQALHMAKVGHDARIDLISLALRGRSSGGQFEKVVKMIDSMVELLGVEQVTDNDKKSYCDVAFDRTDDEAKALNQNIADLDRAIEEAQSFIAQLTDEIAALVAGINELDEQVAEATRTRQAEHSAYTENMASNLAATQLIALAKNRMNRFYNPALHVAAAKRELSAEDSIVVGMGGTAPPTPAPGGIGGTGISALVQDAPPPPPEAVAAYAKKGEESTGVIAMMDLLIADLDKEMQEFETDETNAQAEYETLMEDSSAKRMADMNSVAAKQAGKAETEAALHQANTDKSAKNHEFFAKSEEIGALHQECDWLLANFLNRKEARTGEIASLKNAKAVLSGADYSLLQASRVLHHQRS
jgi:hypothetical protein